MTSQLAGARGGLAHAHAPSVCLSRAQRTARKVSRRGREAGLLPRCAAEGGGRNARKGGVGAADGAGGGLNPNLEMAVPKEQRPVNELTALREGPFSGWAGLEVGGFVQRLGLLWLGAFAFSCPVAAGSYEPSKDTIEFLLSAGLGACAVQTAVVLRIYTSWSYVSNRLLSAAIEYEETGWYDGQTFLKPPEVLARDRLLGTYEVKPIMSKLKLVLYGTLGGLVACALSLTLFDNITETYASKVPSARLTQNGILYNSFITDINVLKESDDAAAAEAKAQKGRPGYCGDEYYRALAGGSAEACKKFDN